MKKKTVLTWIVMIALAAAIIVGYRYISGKWGKEKTEPNIEKTEIDLLLEKNIDDSYPLTPREVVKLYSRFTKCFYSEELDEESLKKMAAQIQMLFDEELLKANPLEEYITGLQADILVYRKEQRKLISYEVGKSSDLEKWTKEGIEYARLVASYALKEARMWTVREEFILRKDKDEKWKILGWRLLQGEDTEKE